MLGYPGVIRTHCCAQFGEGTGGIHMNDITCQGDEDSLLDCDSGAQSQQCTHADDVGVSCELPGKAQSLNWFHFMQLAAIGLHIWFEIYPKLVVVCWYPLGATCLLAIIQFVYR